MARRAYRAAVAAVIIVQLCGCGRSPLRQPQGLDASTRDAPGARDRHVADLPRDQRPAIDQPRVDAGPPAPNVLRACVIAGSCALGQSSVGITWPHFSPGACLDAFGRLGWYESGLGNVSDPDLAQRLLKCTTTSDCAKLYACFGGNWISLSRCREGGKCQKDQMLALNNNAAYLDCSAFGATCTDLWSGAQRACCNAQPCKTAPWIKCSGAKGTYCHGWAAFLAFDCAATGRVCNADHAAICRGTGAACKPGQPTTCAGSVATFCSGGRLASHDCAKSPYRSGCAAGTPYRACKPAGKACDPQQYMGQCAGSQLKVCQDGDIVSVDCKALGFAGCDLPAGAPARCVHQP